MNTKSRTITTINIIFKSAKIKLNNINKEMNLSINNKFAYINKENQLSINRLNQ